MREKWPVIEDARCAVMESLSFFSNVRQQRRNAAIRPSKSIGGDPLLTGARETRKDREAKGKKDGIVSSLQKEEERLGNETGRDGF